MTFHCVPRNPSSDFQRPRGHSLTTLAQWLRWQLPYVATCYAYFPVTLVKRVLLKRKQAYLGLDPLVRRFWDKWGAIPQGLRAFGAARHPIWINMNSGGEVIMSLALLKRLEIDEGPFILSTESYDSFELLCRTYNRTNVFFPPWDTRLTTRRVLGHLQPRALVFVQNAYFPILLRQARRKKIQTILVNGLLSRNVESGNPTMARALGLGFYRDLDVIAVQTEQDHAAFRQLGVPADRLEVTGDLAADLRSIRLTPAERLQLRQALGLEASDPVLVVGSAHPGEFQVMLEAFAALRRHLPETRFIVAPRWIHEADALAERFTQSGFQVVRNSELASGSNGAPRYTILILDTFGELRTVYAAADVAFIGSSLVPINDRGGGHNPLEPLAHGVVPLFGPHMNLWTSAVQELRGAWPALQVDSPEELAVRASQILSGQAPVSVIREIGTRLIDRSSGAVDRTAAFLREHLQLHSSARAVLGSEPSSGAVTPGPRYLRAGEARGALNFLGPRRYATLRRLLSWDTRSPEGSAIIGRAPIQASSPEG